MCEVGVNVVGDGVNVVVLFVDDELIVVEALCTVIDVVCAVVGVILVVGSTVLFVLGDVVWGTWTQYGIRSQKSFSWVWHFGSFSFEVQFVPAGQSPLLVQFASQNETPDRENRQNWIVLFAGISTWIGCC